jgi:uncharacterized protein YkwD
MTSAWTRKVALAVVAGALLIAPASASAGQWDSLIAPESACPGQSNPSMPAAAQVRTMLCMHAYARAQAGVQPLRVSRELRRSSSRKARDIRRCHQFSHNACGRDPFYWVRRVGFERGSWGAAENLALGAGSTTGTVRSRMTAWIYSDEHRTILLTPQFDQVGISVVSGRYRGARHAMIWVSHFGYH